MSVQFGPSCPDKTGGISTLGEVKGSSVSVGTERHLLGCYLNVHMCMLLRLFIHSFVGLLDEVSK